jgi:hypothetical protein
MTWSVWVSIQRRDRVRKSCAGWAVWWRAQCAEVGIPEREDSGMAGEAAGGTRTGARDEASIAPLTWPRSGLASRTGAAGEGGRP